MRKVEKSEGHDAAARSDPPAPASQPQAVLFACGLNSVRSPMAAAMLKQMLGGLLYVGSAGVRKGELDHFAAAAMDEIGLDIRAHRPMTFEELEDLEGLNFDLIITLSPEAHHRALELTRTLAADVEYWPTADPTAIEGSREQRMNAYREVRDQLLERIRARFRSPLGGNE
jgi:protein-tyrosine-phosphatase